jgi:hypothetical protein
MEYLQYIPPDVVAKDAREALAKRTLTKKERWLRLVRSGLIKVLDDGTVKVCYKRDSDEDNEVISTKVKKRLGRRKNT